MDLRKILRDVAGAITGHTGFRLRPDAFNGTVYPLNLEFTLSDEGYFYGPFDARGIPLRCYELTGRQYNPTRIAAYALAHYSSAHDSGDERSRALFLKMAAWFLESEDAVWRYEFPWNGLSAPWISAMAQGEGISVLVRAYRETGDDKWLRHALRATAPLSRPLEAVGLRSKIDGRWEFLEEIPLPQPNHTLNGFLYALVGLHDLIKEVPDVSNAVGFDALVGTLSSQWLRWDLSFWSAYDLDCSPNGRRNYATVAYHQIHVALINYLAGVLCSTELGICWRKWDACAHSLQARVRALLGKIQYRLEVPAER